MLPVSSAIPSKINPSETNYPKSLTILLNTRIRGYPKLKYEPSMSIPGTRSETVYFDPLVKLNNSVAGSVPKGYPPSELYTQFFDKGGFDSLISRTLSTSLFGQGKRTIEQATDEGYVDNNIKVTLNQLFKSGNRFYIKGQPFTINSYDWNYGDWKVGTKNIERRFATSGSSYGEGINSMMQVKFSNQEEAVADQELANFKATHPEYVMRGKINPRMSKFDDTELLLTGVAAGVSQKTAEAIATSPDVTVNPEKQKALPDAIKQLVATELLFDSAINADPNTPNMGSDPISKSLLNALNVVYLEEKGENPDLVPLFEIFQTTLKEYQDASDKFKSSLGLLDKDETNFEELDATRQDLKRNRDEIIGQLEAINFSGLSREVDSLVDMYRQTQPQPLASPSGTPINTATIAPQIESIKKQISDLIKTQESLVKDATTNPQEMLQKQIDVFSLIKSADASMRGIEGLLNGLTSIYGGQQLDSGTRIQTQLGLQQIGQLVKQSARLHNALLDKYKGINYDTALPIKVSNSVLKLKGVYDKLLENFIKMVDTYKKDGQTASSILSDDTVKSKVLGELGKLQKVRQEYFKTYKQSLYDFLNKINKQINYIKAFCNYIKLLLSIQKKKLDKMYKKKKDEYDSLELLKLVISVEMLEFDYSCYFSLLAESDDGLSYTDLLGNFEKDIKDVIAKLDNLLDNPYNARDSFEIYFNYSFLLTIEKHQLDCYNIKVLIFDIHNEEMLWKKISAETDKLFERIKGLALKSIGKTYLLYSKYTETFPDSAQRANFLKRYNEGQVPVQKTSLLSFRSSTSSRDAAQREQFVNLLNAQVISYTYITLYARLSTITLSRQLSSQTQQLNLVNAERNYYTSLKRYYETVKKNFAGVIEIGLLSDPLYEDLEPRLWTRPIPNINPITALDKLIAWTNEKLGEFMYKKIFIEDAIAELNVKFKTELDALIPYISKMGVFKACVAITNPENLNQNPISITEQNRINFLKRFIKDDELSENCDDQLTWAFLEYYSYIRDKQVNPAVYATISEKISQWSVYSYIYNEPREKQGSILEAFVTALNGQLIVSGRTTKNKYAVDGKFTIQGIRLAIAEQFSLPENKNYINYYSREATHFCDNFITPYIALPETDEAERELKSILRGYMEQEWEKIKFMFRDTNLEKTIESSNSANCRDFILTYADIKSINSRITSAQGYFGDRVILPLLENIFKIKSVVIDSYDEQIREGSFVQFLDDGNNRVNGFVKEINFASTSVKKDLFEASPFQKNFELMRQKIVLGMLKEILVSRRQEIEVGESRRPKDYKTLLSQYETIINSVDVLLGILETMKCPFFYNSSSAFDATLKRFNDTMTKIFRQANITQFLEGPLKNKRIIPLTILITYFNGDSSSKGFLADVIAYYPTFIIKTQDSSEFQMSCQRFIPGEQNFFIAQQLIPSGKSTQIDDFMFLLCDNISETYSNIFSFTENRFIYDYREIPPFYNMLIFNSLVKFSNATDVPAIQGLPFFRDINPEYIQTMVDYKTKIDADNSSMTTSNPIEIKDTDIPVAVRRGTRARKQVDLSNPYAITRGGASLSSGYVSANRGNTSYASNRDSRLSYYVIIDLDLYPGKDGIPLAQKAVLACQNRYEKIRQAWAKLFGLVYRPNELYVTGFTAPSALKKRGEGDYRRGDDYRSTRRRRDRDREYETRPRNRTERSREQGRDRDRDRDRDRYREREA
jgi:hypothetical protein